MSEKIPSSIEAREANPPGDAHIYGDWWGVVLLKSVKDGSVYLVNLGHSVSDVSLEFSGSEDNTLNLDKIKETKAGIAEVPMDEAEKLEGEMAKFGDSVHLKGSLFKKYYERIKNQGIYR